MTVKVLDQELDFKVISFTFSSVESWKLRQSFHSSKKHRAVSLSGLEGIKISWAFQMFFKTTFKSSRYFY